MKIKPTNVLIIVDDITELLDQADQILSDRPNLSVGLYDAPEQMVENCIEESFVKTLILLENLGHTRTYNQLEDVYKKVQNDKDGFLKKEWGPDAPYLVWSSKLRTFLEIIKDTTKTTTSGKKKLRPSQQAKIKCREIAEQIWNKDPTITIADMIKKKEILPHREIKDGTLYTEKTVRNWIKDLCPNNSPGRRPKRKKGP